MSTNAGLPGILMVDDNPLAAAAMERRFIGSTQLRWLGWTADSSAIVPMVRERAPAVVLLDVDMPLVDCFAVLRGLLTECPQITVIMFSGHHQSALVERALAEGAAGYIHKDEPTLVIGSLVARALKGECVLSPLVAKTYMRAGAVPD